MRSVCALMTVALRHYGKRGEFYFRHAIESILCQTYFKMYSEPCRIIIVIDEIDQQQKARRIIESYKDPRLCIIQNQENLGLTMSLNIGLTQITEDFILRQDSDDFSDPSRLEKQMDKMLSDDTIGAVGDNYGVVNECLELTARNGADPEKLPLHMLAGAIAGAGSLLRTKAVREVGGWQYRYAQDFYMWVSMRKAGYRVVSLKETLYYYRQHRGQISQRERNDQKDCHATIIQKECGHETETA